MSVTRLGRSAVWSLVVVMTLLVGLSRGQPTTQASDIEAKIRAQLPKLAERATGREAVEALQALRDERVLRLFEHLRDNAVYTRDGTLVFVTGERNDPAGTGKIADVYDLFVEIDDTGKPAAAPLATMPLAELSGKDFSVPRPVRVQINNALRVLGLKMEDPALRKQAAIDLGNRRQAESLPELREIAEKDPDSGDNAPPAKALPSSSPATRPRRPTTKSPRSKRSANSAVCGRSTSSRPTAPSPASTRTSPPRTPPPSAESNGTSRSRTGSRTRSSA
ncbi:MAG: hypothetical protein QM754_19525 [Tepidisphaeraceae bacterium]